MINEPKRLLREEFRKEVEELSKISVGSEEYKVAVDGVAKIADRIIEIEKLEVDARDKEANREADADLEREQMAEEKKDRIIRNVITVLTTAAGFGLTIWGYVTELKYDEKGAMPRTLLGKEFAKGLFRRK